MNDIKANDMELDILEVPLLDEYIPELSHLVAVAYLVINTLNISSQIIPFLKAWALPENS
jgi:hypothetical protein